MFHVEQINFLFWAASVFLGAAHLAASPINPQPETIGHPPALNLVLAGDNTESAALIAHGIEELLLCDDANAERYFTQAIAADADCSPLAYVGLYLAQTNGTSDTHPLELLKQRVQDLNATPSEAFYLATFLLLTQNNIAQAQEDFAKRANRYRADLVSACWAIQLLHYSDHGYTEDGETRPLQQHSLERAKKLYTSKQDNALVCFLRALVEESAPEISGEALCAAEHAAGLLPDHPTVLHLHAHLLYRTGKVSEAAKVFHQVHLLAKEQQKENLALQARLYESVSLWSAGREKEALAIRRELNALVCNESTATAKSAFLTWEAHTLPLRILILRTKDPDQGDINAATKAALPNGEGGTDSLTHAVLCIKESLQARLLVSKSKNSEALLALRRAEKHLTELENQQKDYLGQNRSLATYWFRMHDAACTAINTARAKLYPGTAEVWKSHTQQIAGKPATAQLPPAIPVQLNAKK